MKSEKMYEFLVALENESNSSVTMRMIQEMKDTLMKEISAQKARKNGTATYIKNSNAILKRTAKDVRDCLHTAFIREDGNQYVTDGYRAYKFKNHIDVATNGEGVSVDKVFNQAKGNGEPVNENVEKTLEKCLEAISKYNARKAAQPVRNRKWIYPQNELCELVKFGKNYYNPAYLKEFLETTTVGNVYTIMDSDKPLSPIYSINDDGVECVLLPCRV